MCPASENQTGQRHDLAPRVGPNEVDEKRNSEERDGGGAPLPLAKQRTPALAQEPDQEHGHGGQHGPDPRVELGQVSRDEQMERGIERDESQGESETRHVVRATGFEEDRYCDENEVSATPSPQEPCRPAPRASSRNRFIST